MPSPTRIPFIDLAAEHRDDRLEIERAIARVLDSGCFLLGEELDAFEREFAAYNNCRHAVGVGSGLSALKLMLQACDIGPGDDVIVPANTYIATWLAVSAVGAAPVPVEPDRETRNIDVSRLEEGLSPRTRAVLAVHLYGNPCDMTTLRAFCDKHGLKLLVDAAQSCGAEWRGDRSACLGDAAAFSFYPTKNLGAVGDAGAVATDCPKIAETVRLLRNYGMKDRYNHDYKGENARLEELQAAVLRVGLRRLDARNARRRTLAGIYLDRLAGDDRVSVQKVPDEATSAWHLFTVTLRNRDHVVDVLEEQGVSTSIHYPVPPHLSGAYRNDRQWPALPVTEAMAEAILSLPLYPTLDERSIHNILERMLPAL